ncbi:DUF1002 domain-containing protein [Hutsoniella sourekii]|uniref:DUF1002 domain-containing protein n=1 Tax=Hutsoniella sourekii TaxID=87650 RepID=UPI000488A411|nr:DUF1002 domain-containing protein [Hutsoniella sourekii]
MKKLYSLFFLLLCVFIPTPVFGQEPINNQVAIGQSNSKDQKEELLSIFGVEGDSGILVDGKTLNKYLNDGSDENTSVFSSVLVNVSDDLNGVSVEILTPENITEVSASAYENAAITAGAIKAQIKIASVEPVTGEGALGGVYEIFTQAGYNLNSDDIQTAENLIAIEQSLLKETNMSEKEISKLVTEYNLAIINALTDQRSLTEQDVLKILNEILAAYNFQFSQSIRSKLIEHGTSFANSDVSKDPATKKALEDTMARYQQFDQVLSQGNIEVKLNEIYFTDDRNEHWDKNYDNVLVVDYSIKNNGNSDLGTGSELTLYVDGQLADQYFLLDDTSSVVSPNRQTDAKVSFGFNGARKNLELELADVSAWNESPLIIKLDEAGTPVEVQTNNSEPKGEVNNNIGSGLSEEIRSQIKSEELITLLDAFVEAGLNEYEPRIMGRDDFGVAPLVADEAVQFGAQFAEIPMVDEEGNEDPYNYGRLFTFSNSKDLENTKAYYDDLAKQSAMLYSHTYSKGNILLQMGGDVPDEDFAKYTSVIDKLIK